MVTGVQSEPVPGVTDGHGPGKVSPEVHLLFGVSGAFGQFIMQLLCHLLNSRIEHRTRHHLIDQSPVEGCVGIDVLTK